VDRGESRCRTSAPWRSRPSSRQAQARSVFMPLKHNNADPRRVNTSLAVKPIPFAEPISISLTPHHALLVDLQACIRHNPEQRPLASEVYDMLAAAPSEHIAGEDTPYVRA